MKTGLGTMVDSLATDLAPGEAEVCPWEVSQIWKQPCVDSCPGEGMPQHLWAPSSQVGQQGTLEPTLTTCWAGARRSGVLTAMLGAGERCLGIGCMNEFEALLMAFPRALCTGLQSGAAPLILSLLFLQ
jgi:hypothetical protein